jgi:CheY-like chemotaxis protein
MTGEIVSLGTAGATSQEPKAAQRLPLRLAIADDNEDFAAYVRKAAEAMNVAVRCYPTGGELCADLRSFLPDIIFLDIMMPEMDGIEVAQALVTSGWNGRLVIASGCEQQFVNAAIANLRATPRITVRVLRKPLPLATLRRELLSLG